jgi:BTB/POZ domain
MYSTLTGEPASMLARMFGDGALQSARDSQGRVFIDRDGTVFSLILQWLRDRHLSPDLTASQLQALRREADFFQLSELAAAIASPVRQQHADKIADMRHKYAEALDKYLERVGGLQYATPRGWADYALELCNTVKLPVKTILEPQLKMYVEDLQRIKNSNENAYTGRAFCPVEIDRVTQVAQNVQREVARLAKHDLIPLSLQNLPKVIIGLNGRPTSTLVKINTCQLVDYRMPIAEVLQYSKDTWIDPPNEFWSVHHDKLVRDTWEQYLVDIAV